MFITSSGSPAGYGNFLLTATAGENIIPAMKESFKTYDTSLSESGTIFSISHIRINVDADCLVSVNGRAPILVKDTLPLEFDVKGIYSLTFSAAVKYSILAIY